VFESVVAVYSADVDGKRGRGRESDVRAAVAGEGS
jgi:hypothetical protein